MSPRPARGADVGTRARTVLRGFGKRIRGVDPMIVIAILGLGGFAISLLVSQSLRDAVALPAASDGLGAGSPGSEALLLCGSMTPHHVMQGQVWRLVSAIFLHGSLLHLALNGVAFVQLGRLVRGLANDTAFIVVFGVTGVFASAASFGYVALGTDGPLFHAPGSIGASGAICGLGGFLLGSLHGRHDPISASLRRSLVVWVGMIILIGLTPMPIDNAAHFGGLASGWALGMLTRRRTTAERVFSRAGATLVAAVFAAGLLAAAWAGLGPWGQRATDLIELREAYGATLGKPDRPATQRELLDARERFVELARDPDLEPEASALVRWIDARVAGGFADYRAHEELGEAMISVLGPISRLSYVSGAP